MPYAVKQTEHGWGVQNTESGNWKSKDASKEDAEAQFRLLQGIEHHTLVARGHKKRDDRS